VTASLQRGAARPAESDPGASDVAVSRARLLHDWARAAQRARDYIAVLGLPAEEAALLVDQAIDRAVHAPWRPDFDAVGATLAALRELLAERGEDAPPVPAPPAVERRPMRKAKLGRRASRREEKSQHGEGREVRADRKRQRHKLRWARVASRRRLFLAALILIPTLIAANFMLQILPDRGWAGLDATIALLFGLLFGWISLGFWTALAGFFVLVFGRDRWLISRADATPGADAPIRGRTAVVMPISEEDVTRVFAGLRATWRSLERTGMVEHFDFFILSDSWRPETWLREEAAWAELCREAGPKARIFYRRRRARPRRKSGNVAEFCRRWGTRYDYMVGLDADSVMSGTTIVQLARLMDARPDAGLIQTQPAVVRARSLLARAQQFSSRLYGPLYSAGLHYWQLGDGQYWGHNAIIRLAPWMEHCGLPRLPGKAPFGGEILSHDFVESALLARAGWSVWLAYDLGGSYEETPPTLAEELARDRRWCQGNLQHLRLLFTRGLYGAYRSLFVNGAMAYASGLLWLTFLVLSTVLAVLVAVVEPNYFPSGRALFPAWPIWRPEWAMWLLAATGAVLFLPKVLGVLWALPRRKSYGGFFRLLASVPVELVLSSLLAPIRMFFHTKFVLTNLLGRTVTWRAAKRGEDGSGWLEAIRRHGVDALIALGWGAALYTLNPEYLWWIAPVLGALVLSVPVSVLASREGVGRLARRLGLLCTPEEIAPPPEIVELEEALAREPASETRDLRVRAVVDPARFQLHRAQLRGQRSRAPEIRAAREALVERALAEGPASLSAAEWKLLLASGEDVERLHERAWRLDPRRAVGWGVEDTSG
jgi:membrane glycosyltransferase